jgi:hypothetical protein
MPTNKRDDTVDLTLPVDPTLADALSPLPREVLGVLSAPQAKVAERLAGIGAAEFDGNSPGPVAR